MLINLIPDFFTVLSSTDPPAAYRHFFASHHRLLDSYWRNYVVDPDSSHFQELVQQATSADRTDLQAMLERTDVVSLARQAEERTAALLDADVDFDVVIMVGVGAANAGELVVDGRGIAFICLEHFTGITNTSTHGLGLDPALIPMWLGHEIAHVVRYTSPRSHAEVHSLVEELGGNYSYWDTARRASLREHIVNEGLAVETSRTVSPGHAEWEYFGYSRRQYARIRELEPVLAQSIGRDLHHAGVGLRLRYLSDGLSEDARTVGQYVLPERTGYYVGSRLVEAAITARGFPWAIRASAAEILDTASSTAVSA